MRTWVAFTDLKVGDRFRFVYGTPTLPRPRVSSDVYTKHRAGWYGDAAGRKFRTGKLTAVAPEASA